MLRAAIWTLRQPRYAALGALMAVLFVACVGMGTFELHRFREKVDQNHRLKANARADVMPLSTSLVPLTGRGPAPGPLAVRFRTVSVTGSFEPQRQQYLADQSQGGDEGFYVVTPLRTDTGDLLVVRGFTPAVGAAAHPGRVAPPPTGVVQLQGRLQNAQSGDDKFARIGHAEISTINPTQQAQRSEVPTYAAYMTIGKGQPGTAGLRTLPPIKLSNPTGGAGELQLFSYILQWYVFALLAAAAPFLVSRVEIREARREYLGIDPERIQFDAPPEPAALDAGTGGGELAVRGTGELARMGIAPERRRRAARLADRYGRSLGMDALDPSDVVPRSGPVTPRPRVAPGLAEPTAARESAGAPHRATDDYHGSYNDYLWQLALADGEQLEPPADEPGDDEERSSGDR